MAVGNDLYEEGFIRSFHTQRYGYWEASFTIGQENGLNNAFWLNTPFDIWFEGGNVNAPQTVDRMEIDIQEVDHPDRLRMNLHDWAPTHYSVAPPVVTAGVDLVNTFHEYGLEWLPDNTLNWYFDGTLIGTHSTETVNAVRNLVAMETLFSTKVLDFLNPGPYPALDGTTMDVDWVRVYQKPGFSGSQDGAWNNAANWGPDGVPGIDEAAIFNGPSSNTTISLAGADRSLREIYFQSSSTPAFTFAAGNALQLGAISTSEGVGGVTINADVTTSQTFDVDIVAQSDLMFGNYSRNAGVDLNLNGSISAVTSDTKLFFGNLVDQKINVNGAISDDFAGLTKFKEGILTLSAPNQYRGDTEIRNGTIRVTNNQALGAEFDNQQGTVVEKGATLSFGSGVAYTTPEQIEINHNGAPGASGALEVFDGTSVSHHGDVLLGSNSRIGSGNAGGTLTLHGTIKEQGGSRNLGVGGNGTVRIAGAATYTGTTIVNSGVLELSQPHALASSPQLTVASGATLDAPAGLSIPAEQALSLVGTAQITRTPQIKVAGIVDVTARNDGTLTILSGTDLVGIKSSIGFGSGQVIGNVAVQSGGTLEIDIANVTPTMTQAFVQNSNTIGAGDFHFVAFEAENFTNYHDASSFDWNVQSTSDYDGTPTPALGGQALVAVGSDIFFVGGDDDTAQYDVVFTEPGAYTWYVRVAGQGNQNDSFFGPDGNPDSSNPAVMPSGTNSQDSKSRFGVGTGVGVGELKDAENVGGITNGWDWVRSDPAASSGFVTFDGVVVTQQDVDNQQVFSFQFEPRQSGATLDKMALVQTATFTNLTDADLDAAEENATAQFALAAPLMSFEVDGKLDLNAGSTLELGLRGISDFDNLIVTGTANLSGEISISLEDGYTPEIHDAFPVLTASGAINDAGLNVSTGFSHAVVDNQLVLMFTGLPGDFNGNGSVDGTDFLTWQRDTAAGSLSDWQRHYGMQAGAITASSVPTPKIPKQSIPEPNALLLAAFASTCGIVINNYRFSGRSLSASPMRCAPLRAAIN